MREPARYEIADTVVLDSQDTGGRHGFSYVFKVIFVCVIIMAAILAADVPAFAGVDPITGIIDPAINIDVNGSSSDTIRILLLLTLMTLLPSFLLMMTCFTRIIIIFSLLRNAMGLQQTPPNQVLIGLALLISMFIMSPVLNEINETAFQPFSEGTMTSEDFISTAQVPLKSFMLENTIQNDLAMFVEMSRIEEVPEDLMDLPLTTIVPSFMTSEIKRAFTAGFFLFIPFLIIDMVVASSLMSMGMMMLPPITISLPFKLMLFVLVDGWGLLIRTIVQLYRF